MKKHGAMIAGFLLTLGLIATNQAATGPLKVLVFTKVAATGWNKHVSIPAGIACIRALGSQNGFTVDTTEDSSYFTPTNLSKYGTLIFMNAIGSVFDTNQRAALVSYMNAGGGFVALHYSISLDTGWAWYGNLNGGRTASSVMASYANIRENPTHYIVHNLPDTFKRNDEYYVLKTNPRTAVSNITVLMHATVSNNANYPTAWCHPYGGGRAFYTSIGHYDTTFNDTIYRKLLTNAIIWTAGRDSATAVRPQSSSHADAELLTTGRMSGTTTLTVHRAGVFKLTVYDVNGREVQHASVTGNRPFAIEGPAGVKIAAVKTATGALVGCRKLSR